MVALGFHAVMGTIGLTGMLMGVAVSGRESLLKTKEMNKSINMMNAKIEKFKIGYTQLIMDETRDIQDIIKQLNDDVQLITLYSRKIEVEKDLHSKQYRMIQIYGISFVVIIAFLLILKLFGFDEIINNFIKQLFSI